MLETDPRHGRQQSVTARVQDTVDEIHQLVIEDQRVTLMNYTTWHLTGKESCNYSQRTANDKGFRLNFQKNVFVPLRTSWLEHVQEKHMFFRGIRRSF